MTIKNLTQHQVNVQLQDGQVLVLAPEGTVARCTTTTVMVSAMDGVPLTKVSYGAVEGLPDPEPGVLYVVSALVRMAVPSRTDVASPGDLVRDDKGAVVGCKNLVVNS